MQTFKRNQVEGAIAEVMGQTHGDARELLGVRLKRLLETDRQAPPRVTEDENLPRYAFFDGPPPGKGVEVTYTDFTAFGLLLGVELMRAGLPQGEAVWFLRRVRKALETEHRFILAQGSEDLLDHEAQHGHEREVRLGLLVRRISGMTFLVVPADIHVAGLMIGNRGGRRSHMICKSETELKNRIENLTLMGIPIILIELVNPIHRLAYWLRKIEPSRRGR